MQLNTDLVPNSAVEIFPDLTSLPWKWWWNSGEMHVTYSSKVIPWGPFFDKLRPLLVSSQSCNGVFQERFGPGAEIRHSPAAGGAANVHHNCYHQANADKSPSNTLSKRCLSKPFRRQRRCLFNTQVRFWCMCISKIDLVCGRAFVNKRQNKWISCRFLAWDPFQRWVG